MDVLFIRLCVEISYRISREGEGEKNYWAMGRRLFTIICVRLFYASEILGWPPRVSLERELKKKLCAREFFGVLSTNLFFKRKNNLLIVYMTHAVLNFNAIN